MRGATKDVYQVTGNSKEQVTTLCAVSAERVSFHPCIYLLESISTWIQCLVVYLMYTLENPTVLQVAGRACHKTHWNN